LQPGREGLVGGGPNARRVEGAELEEVQHAGGRGLDVIWSTANPLTIR
jgi:hypothetical protein